MTAMDNYAPGTFCWVDLAAHNMDDACAWYGELFGWAMNLAPMHEGQPGAYGFFAKDGKLVAGLGELTPEMAAEQPPAWNSYVSVEDCAATVAKAKSLGANVVFDTQAIPGAGSLAFLADPTGAVFALWQPNGHCGAQLCNEPGSFSWNELATRDIATAKRFYTELFGWTMESMPGPTEVAMIKNAGRNNGHIMQMNDEWGDMPPRWAVYFAVDDTDATVAKVKASGGTVAVPPTDIPPGRFSVIADPQGAHFYIIKLANPGA